MIYFERLTGYESGYDLLITGIQIVVAFFFGWIWGYFYRKIKVEEKIIKVGGRA